MDAGYLSILRTKDFHCVFRYYGINGNTRIYAPNSILILETRSEVKVSEPKMGWDTPPSQDAFTHQIWDSYLK